jgi:hypothetical protein
MKLVISITDLDIEWSEFKSLIVGSIDSKEILKVCYKQSRRLRGLGFSKKS